MIKFLINKNNLLNKLFLLKINKIAINIRFTIVLFVIADLNVRLKIIKNLYC